MMTAAEAVLQDLGSITVRAGQLSPVECTVEAPGEVEQGGCGATPWCIVAGMTDLVAGTWTVRGAAGVIGSCACEVATLGLPGPAACPGSGPNVGGPLPRPRPDVVRAVATATCLGEAPRSEERRVGKECRL